MRLTITEPGKELLAHISRPDDSTLVFDFETRELLKTAFGAWVNRAEVVGDWWVDSQSLEVDLGRSLDLYRTYHPATTPPPSTREREVVGLGKRILINWKPTENWPSAGGSDPTVNTRIASVAVALRNLLEPIDLVIYHEPKDNVSTTNTIAAYRAMWRNVATIFNDSGAINVRLVYVATGYPTNRTVELQLFPPEADTAFYDPYIANATEDVVSTFDERYSWWADTFRPWADLPIGWSEWGIGIGTYTPTVDRQAQAFVDLTDAFVDGAWPRLESISYFDAVPSRVLSGAMPEFVDLANLPRFLS
jgi:hypothetical protein